MYVTCKKFTHYLYQKHSQNDRYKTPSFNDFEELERKYWKNITFVAPVYGADLKVEVIISHIKNQRWKR